MRTNTMPGAQIPAQNLSRAYQRPLPAIPPGEQPSPNAGAPRGPIPDYKPEQAQSTTIHPMSSKWEQNQAFSNIPDSPYKHLPDWMIPATVANAPSYSDMGRGDWARMANQPVGSRAPNLMQQMPVPTPGMFSTLPALPAFNPRRATTQPSTAGLTPQQIMAIQLMGR